jgi:hypothetical protein
LGFVRRANSLERAQRFCAFHFRVSSTSLIVQNEAADAIGRLLQRPAADAVALFCSKEAGWITGQVVAADGGASLMSAALPLAIQQPELAHA